MNKPKTVFKPIFILVCISLFYISCSSDGDYTPIEPEDDPIGDEVSEDLSTITETYFGNALDFENLANYANQTIPNYITKDNTGGNQITDAKATLGRILFYD